MEHTLKADEGNPRPMPLYDTSDKYYYYYYYDADYSHYY